MLRIIGELLHPIAQLRGMHTKVLRCLRIRHAALLDQANSLKLELACELPSLHDPPPVPLKHLTRCLRNRVQARVKDLMTRAVITAGPSTSLWDIAVLLEKNRIKRVPIVAKGK